MKELLLNRWLQLGAVTFVMGVALGVGVWAALLSGGSDALSVGDRLILTTGGTVFISGDGSVLGALEEIFVEQLPLTGVAAVAAGWVDPVLCSPGRGKYFRRDGEDGENPHLLVYNNLDEIIGIYMFSDNEMPAPWKKMDELLGGGGIVVVDHEHWGLFVYFADPTRACSSGDKTAAGTGGTHYAAPSAVRSYEAPPTPTPTLSTSLALEAVAAKMAALTSMSTTFASEPEGLVPAENIQPGDISEVIKAMEGPADTDNQWIDNQPHRGISGTVSGKDLAGLVPSAAADARVTVKIWVSDSHVVRQLRIEGAAASGDPEDSVRIFDLSGFE